MHSTSSSGSNDPPVRVPKPRPSRPVLNLTPAQLERKRAQDRLSQRAARKRTHERIQRLEQEIHELRLRVAAAPNDVGPNILQELHLRNQCLRQELARLQSLLAAKRGPPSDYQADMTPAPSPFNGLFDAEMQLQSQSHVQITYQNCVPNQHCVQNSATCPPYTADCLVPNTQPIHGNHVAAQPQPEWLAPSLRNDGVLSSNFSGSRYSHTAQQHALSCPQSFGCTCIQGLTTQTPSKGHYVSETCNQYTSMMVQEGSSSSWNTYNAVNNVLDE